MQEGGGRGIWEEVSASIQLLKEDHKKAGRKALPGDTRYVCPSWGFSFFWGGGEGGV